MQKRIALGIGLLIGAVVLAAAVRHCRRSCEQETAVGCACRRAKDGEACAVPEPVAA